MLPSLSSHAVLLFGDLIVPSSIIVAVRFAKPLPSSTTSTAENQYQSQRLVFHHFECRTVLPVVKVYMTAIAYVFNRVGKFVVLSTDQRRLPGDDNLILYHQPCSIFRQHPLRRFQSGWWTA